MEVYVGSAAGDQIKFTLGMPSSRISAGLDTTVGENYFMSELLVGECVAGGVDQVAHASA